MKNRLKTVLFVFLLFFSKEVLALNAPLPGGYLTLETVDCSLSVPEKNANLGEDLLELCAETKGRIFHQLGQGEESLKGAVDVRVVNNPVDMELVTPDGSKPPTWSSAVAYPAYNLVILSLNQRSGRPVEGLETVLEHEMSHLALRIALKDEDVPRWFSEGVAIQQSEESSIKRIWLVWTAAFGDSLLPLSGIDKYPESAGEINLAYAQAADFVGYLLKNGGWSTIRTVVKKRSEGMSFNKAIESSYGKPLFRLEHTWRAGLVGKWQWVPLFTGTGAIWGFIVALFLTAYVVTRRRKKKRMVQMETEEEFEVGSLSELGRRTLPRRPQFKQKPPKVPSKIRIDDDIHTLH